LGSAFIHLWLFLSQGIHIQKTAPLSLILFNYKIEEWQLRYQRDNWYRLLN